ncbi:unnamed protein product [Penicillium glandicola]
MSTSSTAPTSRSGSGGPPPKLKDSCDMCSSSKVKCNKEKPICSRCRKLGYPCFYSPARRIGRPHPNRRSTITRKSPETRPCLTKRTANECLPRTPKDGQLAKNNAPEPQGSGIWERSSSGNRCSQNPLHWLDELYMSPTGAEEQDTNTTAALSTGPSALNEPFNDYKLVHGHPQTPIVDLELFNFSNVLNSNTNWLHSWSSEADKDLLPLDMPIPMGQTISQGSSVDAPDSSNLSCEQTPSSDSSEPDCVTGAIEILRHLQTSQTCGIDESAGSPRGPMLAAHVQIASSAINRLSTILVCPCSQKTYVAILVASVCLTFLDMYDSFFQSFGDSTTGSNSDMDLFSEMGGVVELESVEEGVDYFSEVFPVEVLEELSKLANVHTVWPGRFVEVKIAPGYE